MKFATVACIAAFAASGLMAAPAAARPLKHGGASIQQIAEVLRHRGYPAEIGVDDQGDPKITSSIEGVEFFVLCYPNGDVCGSIQFSIVTNLESGTTYETINAWNREQRYGQAWLDDEMDPYLDMSVELEHGASTELIDENLVDWAEIVGKWKVAFGQE